MNEPSILDYLKSIFKSLDSLRNYLKAVFQRKDTTLLVEAQAPVVRPARMSHFFSELGKYPWLTLLVLVLALIAQKTMEPLRQFYAVGIVFYIAALGLALLAFRRGEWRLTPLPADEMQADSFSVRGVEFVLSLIFSAFAFYKMTGNLFTATNVTLWVGAIFFHLRAFWVREPRSVSWPRMNLREFLTRNEWTFRITRWGLLVFIVFGVAVFFRMYRLDTVAPEMTSDHAEKLADVYDITQGMYSIYFPRNSGREPLYIYLCALASYWFGISFFTLKIVAVMGGLGTLLFIYLLGKELGSSRIGLLAVAFAGIGYWPSVIERFGLRISFYPLFAAATLYFFFRAMRRQKRNDYILAGVALGLGLNGYTPFRIVPFALTALFILYLLHMRDAKLRKQAMIGFGLLALTSWIFVIPLVRFAIERPDIFVERAFSRVGTFERPFPAPVWQLFLFNLWTALKQFNWSDGNTWVHSVPGRPALDIISGALLLFGAALVLVRYIRERHWQDLMLLLAVPFFQMPSILSLAFPDENPTLSRTGAALVPVFLLVGFGLDSLLNGFAGRLVSSRGSSEDESEPRSTSLIGPVFSAVLLLGLFAMSFRQNYDLVFNQYYTEYRRSAWNTRDMGNVMLDFMKKGGSADQVRIVPYPYWVDTRLPPLWAGVPRLGDIAIAPENIESTVATPGAKLFMFYIPDEATRALLQELYPNGTLTIFKAFMEDHNFYVFRVPATQ